MSIKMVYATRKNGKITHYNTFYNSGCIRGYRFETVPKTVQMFIGSARVYISLDGSLCFKAFNNELY